jgi:chaperonin GroES
LRENPSSGKVFLRQDKQGDMTMPTQQVTPSKQKTNLKFKPLGNRVLVRQLEAQEKLKGGIILPDTAKKKQEKAEVLAIGTGKKDKNNNLIPIPVKVGDIILMEKYSGQEVTLDDEKYFILRADEIIAIIEE